MVKTVRGASTWKLVKGLPLNLLYFPSGAENTDQLVLSSPFHVLSFSFKTPFIVFPFFHSLCHNSSFFMFFPFPFNVISRRLEFPSTFFFVSWNVMVFSLIFNFFDVLILSFIVFDFPLFSLRFLSELYLFKFFHICSCSHQFLCIIFP